MTKFLEESEGESSDSEKEIQVAIKKGFLKPGLNVERERIIKKDINNVEGLNIKLMEYKLNFPWIERLDMVNGPAPLAPEIAVELEERANKNAPLPNASSGAHSDDILEDDFQREMLFYRQGQAGALEGISRLKKLGIATKRPDDYFAEMIKSDNHMQKVRQKLVAKQVSQQLSERAKKLREFKKYGKQLQVEQKIQKAKEKKEILNRLKNYKKSKKVGFDVVGKDNVSDEDGNDEVPQSKNNFSRIKEKQKYKRAGKDKKYGFGGRKKGSKRNTSESSANFGGPGFSRGKSFKGKGKKNLSQRPGKSKRMKMKQKRK